MESFWVGSQRWTTWDENSKLSVDATLCLSHSGGDEARWAVMWLTFYCSNKRTVKTVTFRCLLNNQQRHLTLFLHRDKLDSRAIFIYLFIFFFLCNQPVSHMFTVSYTFMIQERLLLYEESFVWQYCRNNPTASASVTVIFVYYVQGNADDYDLSWCSYNTQNYTHLHRGLTFWWKLIDASHLLWIWHFFIKIHALFPKK